MCFGCFGRSKDKKELGPVVALDDLNKFRPQNATNNAGDVRHSRLQKPPAVLNQELENLEAESGNPLKDNSSAQAVRRLRALIREKFAIDVEVWENRNMQGPMRRILMAKAARSDEVMKEILDMVSAWNRSDFKQEEWILAQQIKERLLSNEQYRSWESLPPWKRKGFDE
ncbi:hypothetical protein CKM354_000872400 [Cercospora kikuchii]|uniref:Uncharacterized protein n=1 Tax=Cercospora kikuchii TaxID=84275 RepID=A0A9P3CJG4_9PEZI|nr:uncharacterized protein CKM354_000872400 [Cercospora kikuchii]GIZ45564.1 hypothetical protein CKM354_000872400 [Cercospora kikuchii]